MPITASVPKMMPRGRLRRGSFTSPPTFDRSAQPSNAQSTDTSASPKALTEKLPAGTAGVKWPPVFGNPSAKANAMMMSSPPYFAIVVRFCTSEP